MLQARAMLSFRKVHLVVKNALLKSLAIANVDSTSAYATANSVLLKLYSVPLCGSGSENSCRNERSVLNGI